MKLLNNCLGYVNLKYRYTLRRKPDLTNVAAEKIKNEIQHEICKSFITIAQKKTYYMSFERSYLLEFFFVVFLRANKACCSRYSICPLVLLNSASAQASISFNTSGLIRNTNAFFSAMINRLRLFAFQ